MTIYIFAGPTLSTEAVMAEIDVVCRPPAAGGDVYRAACSQPVAIGIVDGRWERTPSVWHKEILWAMSRGIHVFGAAGIGALRAAELAAFGMEGVGAIFEAFRDLRLEDDDEIAVVHGGAEDSYRPHSEAMVNVRATLSGAEAEGIISSRSAGLLQQTAKEMFYPDRSYPRLLQHGAQQGVAVAELEALRAWLPGGSRNQMHDDAIAMLRRMRQQFQDAPEPKTVGYALEKTECWERTRRRIDAELAASPGL